MLQILQIIFRKRQLFILYILIIYKSNNIHEELCIHHQSITHL